VGKPSEAALQARVLGRGKHLARPCSGNRFEKAGEGLRRINRTQPQRAFCGNGTADLQNGLASTRYTITTSSSTGTSLNQRRALAEGTVLPLATPLSQRPATM